jgi:hypothetical protein
MGNGTSGNKIHINFDENITAMEEEAIKLVSSKLESTTQKLGGITN